MSPKAMMPQSNQMVLTDLFVATDLDVQHLTSAKPDVMHDGKVYRRLSPDYFAWLRSRMQAAQIAFRNKQLSPAKWNALRQRFNYVQEQAITLFGKPALKMACQNLTIREYKPPKLQKTEQAQRWLYPANQKLRFSVEVDSRTVAKVDAIRAQAMDLGWTEPQLHQNQGRHRFPCGEDYGLICFIGGDREIARVTESYIEIVHGIGTTRERVLKFHNSKVLQPWMKKVEVPNVH